MLSKKHKSVLELKTNRFVETLMVGNYKTHFKNSGIEFADFKEYQPGDDAKNIDFVTSAKTGKTVMKLFEEERELDVYFLPLFGEEINFSLHGVNKRDILEEILYILGISTIKNQNKFGALFYNHESKNIFPLGKSGAHFFDFFDKIEKFSFGKKSVFSKIFSKNTSIVNKGLEYFNNLSIKNSLVFVFTSDTDIDEKILKVAALKNDVIICNIFHSFENSLDGEGIQGLSDGNNKIFIELDDEEKKKQYRQLRKKKIQNFRKKVYSAKADYLYFDEKGDIFSELFKFFKKR